MQDFVDKYKVPNVTVHTVADKWHGTANDVQGLNRWPVVPELCEDEICDICNPKRGERDE
jgi:hypothetical protein